MSRIRSLKPNLSRDDAAKQFSPGGPMDLFRGLLFGPLRSVGDIYVPFRLFQVDVTNAGKQDSYFMALEAVHGNLDLYHFDQIPSSSEVTVLETRNCPAAELDDTVATHLVIEKFRRVLFSRGFFRLRGLQVSALPLPGEIHIPYWIGFRGHGNRAHLEVIDAVRRRYEGSKVRKLVEDWLASPR
jgi:hypothetical protein